VLSIKNAQIVKNEELEEVNIYIEKGKIKDIVPE